MAKLTDEEYNEIATKLQAKGYTTDTVYKALEAAGFKVKVNGQTKSVYASRVIAIMHDSKDSGNAIEL